jgi:ABC-type antimicrobial peptide transport system, ATPase component
MQTISFHNVVPKVFSSLPSQQSDIWGQDIVLEKGKVYLVEANSGKGKSTFCSYIIGYRRDYSGQILFDSTDTLSFKVSDWVNVRQHQISYLFQELRLFPELTAYENVEIRNKITGQKSREQILQWFDRLGIADKVDVKVGLMSFGQQQRVAMMRALVQPFDFILADEPISHLDDNNSSIMADIMMEEAKNQGAGVIVTSIGKHMNLQYDEIIRL